MRSDPTGRVSAQRFTRHLGGVAADIARADRCGAGHRRQPSQKALELGEILGPAVSQAGLHQIVRKLAVRIETKPRDRLAGERRDIAGALAQRRHGGFEDRKLARQFARETPLGHEPRQRERGRGDDARSALHSGMRPERQPRGEVTGQGLLQRRRKRVDRGKVERSPLGPAKPIVGIAFGIAAIDRDEGCLRLAPAAMDRRRRRELLGPELAVQQDRERARGRRLHEAVELAHRGA